MANTHIAHGFVAMVHKHDADTNPKSQFDKMYKSNLVLISPEVIFRSFCNIIILCANRLVDCVYRHHSSSRRSRRRRCRHRRCCRHVCRLLFWRTIESIERNKWKIIEFKIRNQLNFYYRIFVIWAPLLLAYTPLLSGIAWVVAMVEMTAEKFRAPLTEKCPEMALANVSNYCYEMHECTFIASNSKNFNYLALCARQAHSNLLLL